MNQKIKYLVLFQVMVAHFGTHALPDADDGFKKSDLFLAEPYFLGLPNFEGAGDSTSLVDEEMGSMKDQLSLQAQLNVGKVKEEEEKSKGSVWPGRKSKVILQNTGTDVVSAFQQNLAAWRTRTENFDVDEAVKGIGGTFDACNERCKDFLGNNYYDKCTLLCNLEDRGKEKWSTVSNVLFDGIKTLCGTLNTLYTKFHSLRINNLETFQVVMKKVEAPMPVSSNVPLRSMLANLIREAFTVMTPFRSLLGKMKADLTLTESSLNLKKNILVGDNPGCSMLNMTGHIQSVLGLIFKDPTLSDYILLQGYALFTGLTKYVDEFPSKKEFSVLNQGLDMMTGTTCGLIPYMLEGETSDCDQYGGYPVLNMPIPSFMWPDDLQETCQDVREKMLLNKEEEKARRKREYAVSAAAAAEITEQKEEEVLANNVERRATRRRRSLKVGE